MIYTLQYVLNQQSSISTFHNNCMTSHDIVIYHFTETFESKKVAVCNCMNRTEQITTS